MLVDQRYSEHKCRGCHERALKYKAKKREDEKKGRVAAAAAAAAAAAVAAATAAAALGEEVEVEQVAVWRCLGPNGLELFKKEQGMQGYWPVTKRSKPSRNKETRTVTLQCSCYSPPPSKEEVQKMAVTLLGESAARSSGMQVADKPTAVQLLLLSSGSGKGSGGPREGTDGGAVARRTRRRPWRQCPGTGRGLQARD